MRRREVVKGVALSPFAGGAILASAKTPAIRDQKLIYWHLPTFAPAAEDIVRAQFEEFRQMAGLAENEAAFVPTAHADLIPRLAAALDAGTPPDVVRLYEADLQLCRAGGHLLDVTDVVERMSGQKGGLFDAVLRPAGHEGRGWGVPFAISPWSMHVRLDVLEEHGVAYPRTWEDFVEACLKIQRPRFQGFGMALGLTTNATANIMQVCWCFGGRIYDGDGKPAFDNRGNVEGFAFIDAMFNEHRIIPKEVVGNRDDMWNNRAYQAGRVAFISNPTSVYAYLSTEDPELMHKTGLLGVPAGPAGAINQIETWSFGVFSRAPYPDLAKGLAEHFMAPDRYGEVIAANNGRFVPVYPELFNDSWWTGHPELAGFKEIARTGAPISYQAAPSAASQEVVAAHVIPKALHGVLIDGDDPAAAVAKAHRQIAAISERLAGQRH
jgi:multiple sugar transport system substrate-binding protein